MSAADEFIAKWQGRWPEWRVGAAFLPPARRETAFAWLALLQELTEAAWGGADATPGLAKLAWWNEELLGWAKGARRHPLGERLQALPAPWAALAAGLLPLQQSRALAPDAGPEQGGLAPFAQAVAHCEQCLFGSVSSDAAHRANAASATFDLLAMRQLLQGNAATARGLLEADAGEDKGGTRPRRLHSAFLRQRLRRLAASGENRSSAPWRSLWLAWRAARMDPR